MNALTISNIDGATMSAIEHRAKESGKPVDEEVLDLLRLGLAVPAHRVSAIERARQIRAMTPKGVKQTPAVQLIREDRDR